MMSLSPAEARVVALAVREGLTNREIAERLCVSENTVKTQLRDAREKLGGAGAGWRWWLRASYALGRAEAVGSCDGGN